MPKLENGSYVSWQMFDALLGIKEEKGAVKSGFNESLPSNSKYGSADLIDEDEAKPKADEDITIEFRQEEKTNAKTKTAPANEDEGGNGHNNKNWSEEKKRNKKKRFRSQCDERGICGHSHVRKDRRELEQDAHKRPHRWRSKKVQGGTNVSGMKLCLASVRQDFGSAC